MNRCRENGGDKTKNFCILLLFLLHEVKSTIQNNDQSRNFFPSSEEFLPYGSVVS